MINTIYLKFPTEQDFKAQVIPEDYYIDVIGIIFHTDPMYITVSEGFHVNLYTYNNIPDNLKQFEVFPEQPKRTLFNGD